MSESGSMTTATTTKDPLPAAVPLQRSSFRPVVDVERLAPAVHLSQAQAAALAPQVDARRAWELVESGAVLLDLRSDASIAANGALPGATVVDRYRVADLFDPGRPGRLRQAESATTAVVVVCGSVFGSGPVAAALLRWGCADVVHVAGGFPAWQDAGLPTIAQGPR